MIAWLQSVRFTPMSILVKISRAKTMAAIIRPSYWWVTTLATESAWWATGSQIFRRNSILLLTIGSNAPSIRHGIYCTECPAWSTIGLISHFFNWIAFRPISSGIERIRDVRTDRSLFRRKLRMSIIHDYTHLALDGINSHIVPSLVVAGFPWAVLGVHDIHDIVIQIFSIFERLSGIPRVRHRVLEEHKPSKRQ